LISYLRHIHTPPTHPACLQDITGKAVGIFLPIMAFIAIGGEHCIANQVGGREGE
jgi:hypothetical protein